MGRRRIGLFLWSFENDYQALLRSDCAATARRHGFVVDEFSAEDDSLRQVSQITGTLLAPEERRPTAVMVCPVRERSLEATAQQAVREGIGWVVLNRYSDYLRSLRRECQGVPVFCVNPDQQQIGRIQAQQFRALLPDGGELVYVQGPPLTSSASRRLEGARIGLAGSPIKMTTLSADWTSEGAAEVVRDWARSHGNHRLPPCVVGVQNDQMAEGAKRALEEEARRQNRPELANIPVTGCDGSPGFGQRLVSEGRMAATVVIPPTAGQAVERVKNCLDRGEAPPREIRLLVTSFPSITGIARRAGAGPAG